MHEIIDTLRSHGIQPSPQRIEVARYVFRTGEHPSADQVWCKVKESMPTVSRATIYNTLNLFADKGLIRALCIAEGNTLFDPKMEAHHHFVDIETGTIHDIPWDALSVAGLDELEGFEIRQHQVVLRGQIIK